MQAIQEPQTETDEQGEGRHQEEQGYRHASARHAQQGQQHCQGLDQLLQDWQDEGLHEGIWVMVEAQDASGHCEAVEKAEDHLQEPPEAQPPIQM